MKIVRIEDFHADGGWREFSFLKVTTDSGLIGWSEYHDAPWTPGLTDVVRAVAGRAVGMDPRRTSRLSLELLRSTQPVAGGLVQQAIAAIENACLDIAAKDAGLPVHALFGGAVRDRVPVYWSHCGTYRARHPGLFEDVIGVPRLRSLDDLTELARQAKARGFTAVKTNTIVFERDGPRVLSTSAITGGRDVAQTCSPALLGAIVDQLAAMRAGLGPDIGLMFDVNFSFAPEALKRIVRALASADLGWIEIDLFDPPELARIRQAAPMPVASLEAVYGRRGYRPYLEAAAVDVAIVDVVWNGLLEAVKIANLAEAYGRNVAPHNFYGPLATLMAAQFCAIVPNVHIMETEVEDVPWKDSLVTVAPAIAAGELLIPTGIGWGADVDEASVAAHPTK